MKATLMRADANGEIRQALTQEARGFCLVPAVPAFGSPEWEAQAFPAAFPIQVTCSNGVTFPALAGATHRFNDASALPGAYLSGIEPFAWVLVMVFEGPGDAYLRGGREKITRRATTRKDNAPLAIFVPSQTAPGFITASTTAARAGQTGWQIYAGTGSALPFNLTIFQKAVNNLQTGFGAWCQSEVLAFTATESVFYLDVLAPGDVYFMVDVPGVILNVDAIFEV